MRNKRGLMAKLAKDLNAKAPEEEPAALEVVSEKVESRKARKPAFRRAAKAASAKKGSAASSEAQNLEKMTIKLQPVVRKRILEESFRRKAAGDPNWQIQEIVSEAVGKHLGNN